VINSQYLAGAFALLILAWLALRVIQGARPSGSANVSTLMMRGDWLGIRSQRAAPGFWATLLREGR
jgi:hypothetical protein